MSKCNINLPGYFENSKKKVFVNRSNAQVANRQMHTIENQSLGIRIFFKMSFFIENMNC